ncbi:hypothetical protein GRI40_01215 [Altererythrobacter aerius]|uniref:Uncharacterized protein n=1 Tax=Tsuneonella aeria TaxID=1837929 RepID=A0A6I4T9P8_9SPHN|nr:hypothetical protein [Tsuneonella aeria]MXO73843.1 hypothetical protein [Tsuneonella aeria]
MKHAAKSHRTMALLAAAIAGLLLAAGAFALPDRGVPSRSGGGGAVGLPGLGAIAMS